MTLVHTRESTLRLKAATYEVHRHGGRIWLQIGGAGIYAMEGWHSSYAASRRHPLTAVSRPRLHVKPALRGVPLNVLTTAGVRELIGTFADSAGWAQEAGYDGIQLASSNAKLIHQFLSPYYNRRTDEFGGSLRNRARILEEIARAIREQTGAEYPLSVKIPIGEDAPPLAPHTTFAEGIELCRMAEQFGYDAITPVGLSVFPHASLCRGTDPSDILETKSIRRRFEEALGGSKLKMAVLRWGYSRAAKDYPFEPVWNRPFFTAAKETVSIPIFAVGGIRTLDECLTILDRGEADMVGIGRPFYAEPELPARLLAGDRVGAFCESSNRCVPPQQLGMKARCYNSNVARRLAEARAETTASAETPH
jgi:2,4-dienoyl-CoA reductase-like NADH-dependent reductase (Old Yellow Enzyme family)